MCQTSVYMCGDHMQYCDGVTKERGIWFEASTLWRVQKKKKKKVDPSRVECCEIMRCDDRRS
jgi:hypothetical protein